MADIFDLADTWNNGATTFTAIRMDVTDTASASGSLLLDLLVGGSPYFQVRKARDVSLFNSGDRLNGEWFGFKWNSNVLEIGTDAAGTGTARAIRLGVGAGRKIEIPSIGGWQLYNGATRETYFNWDAFAVRSDTYIGWSSSTSAPSGQGDTNLIRSAAAVVGVRANNTSTGGALEFIEQTAPATGGATSARMFAEDDGTGKTRIMVQFGSGAAQQIAIEP